MNGEYNGDQMLSLCKVGPFDMGSQRLGYLSKNILALFAIEKDPKKLIESLESLLDKSCDVSIGYALERLHSISTIGSELDFDRTGLDALCYNLSSSHVTNAINALQCIFNHFPNVES